LRLNEIEFLQHLREVIAGLGGLAEGEAFGIEVGHAALNSRTLGEQPLNERTARRSLCFGDGGLDCGGDRCDQGGLSGRAEIQGGACLLSKHFFRRSYRLSGTGDGGLHSGALFHNGVACAVVQVRLWITHSYLTLRYRAARCGSTSPTKRPSRFSIC